MTEPAPAIDPARTALLVMDFQNGVVANVGLSDADALVSRVAGALAAMRATGGTVGYVRVGLTDDDWAAVPPSNKIFHAAARNRAMPADDPSTAIDDRLAPRDGDIVVRKVRVGAMSTTDLDAQLRGRGIDTLVLAGISTSGVVLSTVTDAADRDYRLVVLSDGVADRDQQTHEVLVHKVFPRRADVITIAEFGDLLSSGVG
jgi:nicotinamidase-related amidase